MASLSLYRQFKTSLMSNRKVIELLLQLKSAKDHGKNYTTVKPHLVRHLLRNGLFVEDFPPSSEYSTVVMITKKICLRVFATRMRTISPMAGIPSLVTSNDKFIPQAEECPLHRVSTLCCHFGNFHL